MSTNKNQKRISPENVPSVSSFSRNSSCESDLDFGTVHIKEKNKPRLVPSNEEVNLNGELSEFCLFMMLSCLLTASVLVGAISTGCLWWRSSNSYLTTVDSEEPLMFISAVLLLISSIIGVLTVIIVCMAQNQRPSSSDLLLVLLFFSSLILLVTGSGALLSFKLKSQWKLSPSADGKWTKHNIMGYHMKAILEDCEIGHALKKTLLRKIQEYETSSISKICWDSTQKSLQCCGVNGPEDWLEYHKKIPKSCCETNSSQKEHCELYSAFKDGCLDILAFCLKWWLALLGGYGCIHLSFVVLLLLLIICLLIKVQRNKSEERKYNPPLCLRLSVT